MTFASRTISGRLAALCALLLAVLLLPGPSNAAARSKAHTGRCKHGNRHAKHKHAKRCSRPGGSARHGRHSTAGGGVKGANGSGQFRGSTPSAAPAPTTSPAAGGAPTGSHTGCPDSSLVPDPSNLERINASVVCLVNEQRAKNGLGALAGNSTLGQVAAAHNNSMVVNDYFEHVGKDGQNAVARILSAGYVPVGYGYDVGENLGWGSQALAAPIYIVANWMSSPEHRANILNPKFNQTGVSVIASLPTSVGTGQGAIYTQEFGALVAPSSPVPVLP